MNGLKFMVIQILKMKAIFEKWKCKIQATCYADNVQSFSKIIGF